MARTIAEIYAAIVADKDAQTSISALAPTADTEQQLLTALNSTSKVAVWRLWAYITAVAIWTHELIWDTFRVEVQAIADAAYTGTAVWYQAQVLAYQHDDTVTWDATVGKYKYATIDPTKQVVKRCAIVEGSDTVLTFKVAKLNLGQPIALSSPEQTGLSSYINKIRFAGTRYVIISGNGDILKITGNIYYDGSIDPATIKTNVEAAILAYIGQLPFNGQFRLTALTDAIQTVEGVQDVYLTNVSSKTISGNPYVAILRAATPLYGYFVISTTGGETLTDTLTYIAQ